MDSTIIQLATGNLDLPKGVNFPITLSFNEVKLSGGSGGYSQALTIDGSDNNITLLGDLFDIDLTNETFDRNKKTECTVIQNGQEVFTGFLQLMEVMRVNKFRGTNAKKVKLKINVFDEVSNFYIEMADKELSELSFHELNHVFNRTNIIASWDNTEGYTYPIYAKPDNQYTLRDFKPAIFELDYFKKIFAVNGYSFTWDDLADASIRMDKRIIPFNGKEGDEETALALQQLYTVKGVDDAINPIIDTTTLVNYPIGWLPMRDYITATNLQTYLSNIGTPVILDTILQDPQSQWDDVGNLIVNKAGDFRTWTFNTRYNYTVDVKGQTAGGVDTEWDVVSTSSGAARCDVFLTLVAQSTTDPQKLVFIDSQIIQSFVFGGTYTYGLGYEELASGVNLSTANLGLFDDNEAIKITPVILSKYYDANGNQIIQLPSYNNVTPIDTLNPLINVPFRFRDTADPTQDARLSFDISITDLQITAVPDIETLVKGANVEVNRFIPRKVKQRDLIASIAKTYNLVFVPDADDPTNIIIKTRDKYYDDGDEWDWTKKFEEAKENSITFLSNDVKREQVFRYKADRDAINEAYQNEIQETYGQTTIRLDNEYTGGQDVSELIYSPTPSLLAGIGAILPSINGVNPETNIRVLLNNGKKSIYPYFIHDDILPTGQPLQVSDYLHTSMFDNDFTPNFSLTFDAPKLLFHNLQEGQTSNYLYNLHHKREVTTLNSGKMLKGWIDLTEADFQKLSKRLDYKIFIRDNGWFYINKIDKYNATKRTLTYVELITADDESKIKFSAPISPVRPNKWDTKPVRRHYNQLDQDSNIVLNPDGVTIDGRYNFVRGGDVKIIGDKNTVLSNKSYVLGDSNTLEQGATGAKVVGDGKTVTFPTSVINGNVLYKTRIVQSGTTAPILTEYINNVGTIKASRTAVGTYVFSGFPTGLFDGTRNLEVRLDFSAASGGNQEVSCFSATATSLVILTYLSEELKDGILNSTVVGVRYHTLTITEY
jgi:hypothetical protein